MLLIHLLLNSGSVKCTFWDFFLRLFRNYVYHHFIFPKINKRGVVIREGELENFRKINKLEAGRLFGTLEYIFITREQIFQNFVLSDCLIAKLYSRKTPYKFSFVLHLKC